MTETPAPYPLRIRASGLRRALRCRASVTAEHGLPEKESGPEAARGTRIHAALADEMRHRLAGGEQRSDFADHLADDEAECARALVAKGWSWLVEGRDGMPIDAIVEDEMRSGILTGHPDVVAVWDDQIRIIDWKTGWHPPEADDCEQLDGYVALVLSCRFIRPIQAAIVSPLGITDKPYHRPDIAEICEAVEFLAEQDFPVDAFSPGPWCQHCRACGTSRCAATGGHLAEASAAALAIRPETALALPPAEVGRLLVLAKGIEHAVKALEDRARELHAEGVDIPGVTFGKPRRIEKITDPGKVFARVVELGVSPALFVALVDVPKGRLAEAIKASTGLKGQALDAAVAAVLDGASETKETQEPMKVTG
jgi:hypothetical protein